MDLFNTSIHTHLDDGRRISSIYRKLGNSYFESSGWETLLWNHNEIEKEFKILNSVDKVLELHMMIKDGRNNNSK